MGNGGWEMGNGKWKMGNRRMGNGRWEMLACLLVVYIYIYRQTVLVVTGIAGSHGNVVMYVCIEI